MSNFGATILDAHGHRLTADEKAFFRDADPFGFILFARNIDTPDQVRSLCSELRDAVGREAIITIDQEGGRVQRLRAPQWREWLPPLEHVSAAGENAARAMYLRYRIIAHELREIADAVGALLMADISHPSGLIAKGLLNNPMQYCHIVTTTTHKTLRGPRGGMILMGKDFENPFGLTTPKGEIRMMSNVLDMAVFPGTQGGPLEHIIAAKAIAFEEALSDEYMDYVVQVKLNASVMAAEFVTRGYKLISGGTDNHLMLIDLRNKDLTGKIAEETLGKVDITINKNMVPFDDKSPFVTSGIRLGTAAITTRGLNEKDMETIVGLIDEALSAPDNAANLKRLATNVSNMMGAYPLYKD